MVQWLNKIALLVFLQLFAASFCFSQNGAEPPVYKDYKDPEQFEKFRKRSITVGAWQIHTLKEEGALVVKLKTNKLLIDQLIKQGKTELAIEKQLEQFAVNRNTMFAYRENFNFCKVYFIYSTSSDTLLNGARQGMFLDTNLIVDPSIVMPEKFYLIAEKDFAYSSSIGFVREDSARSVKETGNPIKAMAIVLKNKYGHQLKNPMPYAIKEGNLSVTAYEFPVKYTSSATGASSIYFPVNRTFLQDLKNSPSKKIVTKTENGYTYTSVTLRKESTYEKLSHFVDLLNEELFRTLTSYPKPDINRIRPEVKLFLY